MFLNKSVMINKKKEIDDQRHKIIYNLTNSLFYIWIFMKYIGTTMELQMFKVNIFLLFYCWKASVCRFSFFFYSSARLKWLNIIFIWMAGIR